MEREDDLNIDCKWISEQIEEPNSNSNKTSKVIRSLAVVGIIGISKSIYDYFKKDKVISTSATHELRPEFETGFKSFLAEQDIPEVYLCPISWSLIRYPYQISECGHSFDHVSICRYLNDKNVCPMCKTACKKENLILNRPLLKIIQEEEKNLIAKYEAAKNDNQ